MSREVKAAPWDIENVQVPTGENPEDVIKAIKHFVQSVGCKNDFRVTCFTGSAYHPDRGIPTSVYQKLRETEQVDIVSWAKDGAVRYIPKQAADGLMKDFVEDLCCVTTRGVLVVIGGDHGYKELFDTVRKNTELDVIWIYPFGVRTASSLMRIANPIAAISFEHMLLNFKTYRRLAVAPSVAVKDGPRRSRETSSRRRSPVPRRGASPRRLPDSPPRRRPGSPIRRRGETPPRRRPAWPSRGRSPSSPSPRRLRSPRGSPRRIRGSPEQLISLDEETVSENRNTKRRSQGIGTNRECGDTVGR